MAFKPVKPERGSIKTEGFYFTSMRFPVEQAKKISRRANVYGLSYSEYVRQAAEFAMAADKADVKGVKADAAIHVSVGTTKDYKNGESKKAKKTVKAEAKKKPAAAAVKVKAKAKKVVEEEDEEKPAKKKAKPAAASVKIKKKAAPPPPDDEEEVAEEEVAEEEEEVADD